MTHRLRNRRPMPTFKPAYLIHGDDHGRIAERRRRLRALAEQGSGTQGIEVFEGDAATPDAVANALNALTFAVERRFIIVDSTERWTDKQFEPLVNALKEIPPDTTVAFFAREERHRRVGRDLLQGVHERLKLLVGPPFGAVDDDEPTLDREGEGVEGVRDRIGGRGVALEHLDPLGAAPLLGECAQPPSAFGDPTVIVAVDEVGGLERGHRSSVSESMSHPGRRPSAELG